MPKSAERDENDIAFGNRLAAILKREGQPRRGAGAYLARKYKVSTVTANAWLNGEHRMEIPLAKRIAEDHGSTFSELYFGEFQVHSPQAEHEVINLVGQLPDEGVLPLMKDLSLRVSTGLAAQIAAIFAARVQRDLEEGKA